jgi:thiol-disulfide isomerase/thioredoxin
MRHDGFKLWSVWLFLISPFISFTQHLAIADAEINQDNKVAVLFQENLSWSEVLIKAKMENRYIFLDCFTTWCGPCKRMDKEVYTDDSVGSYYNRNFISVKMQMDKTKDDGPTIKSRYNDASFIAKKYAINAYPTLLFLSPNGEVVNKELGFQHCKRMLEIGLISMQRNKKYVDPNAILYDKIAVSRMGNRNDGNFRNLISMALGLRNYRIVDSLSVEYLSYLRQKRPSQLYTKEELLFIGKSTLSCNDSLFNLFYPSVHGIDKIVGERGFARRFVDRSIKRDYFDIVLKRNNVVNWDSIFNLIKERYTVDYAKRGVAAAKTRWYEINFSPLFRKSFVQMIEKYGREMTLIYGNMGAVTVGYDEPRMMEHLILNSFCWLEIFKRSDDRKLLSIGIRWMERIVKESLVDDDIPWWAHLTFDTYANLLYKKGNVRKAIKYESLAVKFAKVGDASNERILSYEATIQKMRDGIPTWKKAVKN